RSSSHCTTNLVEMNSHTCCLFLLAGALVACGKPVELETHGRYFIDNRTDTALYAKGTMTQGTSAVFTDSISAHTRSLFLEVSDGSGGHVRPSNFLITFMVSADSMGTLVEVYSGVHNDDWLTVPTASVRDVDLVLVIE
ncbi:MAG: hypothetical protein ABI432_07925, partial [Flavobacteriales bacterium]